MRKSYASEVAIYLANTSLHSNPQHLIGGYVDAKSAANNLADFIKTLSDRLEADMDEATRNPFTLQRQS